MNQNEQHFFEFSDYQNFERRNKMTAHSMQTSHTKLEVSLEMLVEGIYPNISIEFRAESILKALIGNFGGSRLRRNGHSKAPFYQLFLYSSHILLYLLMEDIKSVVKEIHDFEYWNSSILMALLRKLRTIKIPMQGSK